MTRYALLCGSAPEDFRQKKLADMHDFLVTEAGGTLPESNIVVFPNGVPELMLESVLNNTLHDECDSLLLYFCTETPFSDDEASIWLCGNEIRKSVVNYYVSLAKDFETDFQVMYDWDKELVSESELGYEAV